jgi:DivIVA domain-containing protein
VTSNGQRFRRRSLRRGYKVDEVDLFLDRVEATLNGDSVNSPVRSQEVHDVVFRVRFGGYDEWQVDLHLDRVERQLADQETGAPAARGPERPAADRMPERIAPERMPERMPPPPSDRPQMQPPVAPLPTRSPMGSGMGGPQPAGASGYPSYNEPTYAPQGSNRQPMPPQGPSQPGNYGSPAQNPPQGPPQGPPGYDPSRHGRMDMTTEMRMPDMRSNAAPPSAPPGRPQQSPQGDRTGSIPTGPSGLPTREPSGPPPGMTGPSSPGFGGGAPAGPPPSSGGNGAASPGEIQRIDQMRRTFQPRRFGSGYDRMEVDRLFEGVIAAMSGRSTMPVKENELDPGQFNLVPGGYFEAEVDQALREVREIFRRH